MKSSSDARGFTLIELMIAVAIVAILAAIALPAYQESVRKGRRADAQAALLGLAGVMERDFLRANRYTNVVTGGLYPNRVPLEGGTAAYTLSVSVPTATTYTLTATPTGPQTGDRCGNLTLASSGAQGAAQSDCWRR